MKSGVFILLLSTLFSFGQTGPGGVGKPDGTSDLVLWLNASNIEGLTDGEIVPNGQWKDASGYGHHFTGNYKYIKKPDRGNGNPVLYFNGKTYYLERTFTKALNTNDFTAVYAVKTRLHNSEINNKTLIYNEEEISSSTKRGYRLFCHKHDHTAPKDPKTSKWIFSTGGGSNWEQTINPVITIDDFAGLSIQHNSSGQDKRLYVNETEEKTSTAFAANKTAPMTIGASNDGTKDEFFIGDMGEIILYKKVLNKVERILIANYLAAKYGYKLDNYDYYEMDYDNPADIGKDNYDYDVAGIGMIKSNAPHNDSQGTGIIRIKDADGLGHNEFLFWGCDSGALSFTSTDAPDCYKRLERVWAVSEVGEVGKVSISFDFLKTTFSTVNPATIALLMDTDNDGDFSDETPQKGFFRTTAGNIYEFSEKINFSNKQRFTLSLKIIKTKRIHKL